MSINGMKQTKPGQLRSFAAYPRCWADRGVICDTSGPALLQPHTSNKLRAAVGQEALTLKGSDR
jgi:hypothetical protein